MPASVLNNLFMKKEIIMAFAGTALLAIAFVFHNDTVKESSPAALFIITIAGLLTSFRYHLVGGTLLFFSGLALAVHPFQFSSSFWLMPGAILVSLAGFIYLVNWWKQNGQSESK
jgi:hypothetical protein